MLHADYTTSLKQLNLPHAVNFVFIQMLKSNGKSDQAWAQSSSVGETEAICPSKLLKLQVFGLNNPENQIQNSYDLLASVAL